MAAFSSFGALLAQRRQVALARDEARGYAVSHKRLALAYVIEIVVIAASLYGAWLFAKQYGHNDADTVAMMMLAPVGYAIIEFCRVPLAFSARTQTSVMLRVLAAVGVICSAGVTVKSMSQLGEVMFRPRLMDVAQSRQDLRHATDRRDLTGKQIEEADNSVALAKSELDGAQKRVTEASGDLGKLPPNRCSVVTSTTADGRRVQQQRCNQDPRVATMNANLKVASDALDGARARLETATAFRRTLDIAGDDTRLTAARVAYDKAISHSQLHSFTAMAFGKDPQNVDDGEVAQFLRIFVFVPAFLVAFAATSLAVTSVTRLRKPRSVAVPDEAAAYILGPYAQTIIEEAAAAARRTQDADIAAAVARTLREPAQAPRPDAPFLESETPPVAEVQEPDGRRVLHPDAPANDAAAARNGRPRMEAAE